MRATRQPTRIAARPARSRKEVFGENTGVEGIGGFGPGRIPPRWRWPSADYGSLTIAGSSRKSAPPPRLAGLPSLPHLRSVAENLGGLFPSFPKIGTFRCGVDDGSGMGSTSRHFREFTAGTAPGAIGCRRLAATVIVFLSGITGLVRGEDLPPAPRLPDLVRTSNTAFAIPFKVAPSQQADHAAARVLLQASRDLGATWEQAGEAGPEAGSIVYRAAADGEYWFRLRAVDAKGRQRGGEGPDMRVLVDVAAPRVSARVWRGADGEVVCRYAAADDTLDLPKMVVEYQTKAEPTWKKIAAEAVLSRESPAHLIGEEIWWAGEKVEALTVRISVSDAAGHRTVKQFTMEGADPGVEQGALAAEIGVPALPGQSSSAVVSSPPPSLPPPSPPTDNQPAASTEVATTPPGGWAADPSGRWAGDGPVTALPPSPEAGQSRSVLARPVGTGGRGAALNAGGRPEGGPAPATLAPAKPAIESAAPGPAARALPTEYRGRPLQIVRSRRFTWDYEMQSDRPDTVPVRVELWSTSDGGVTWQRSAVDDDGQSPIDVTLPAAGLYGFRLEIVPDLPDAGGGPRSGEMPEGWIGIDDEPPQVEIVEATRLKDTEPGGVLIRWAARDQILVPKSVRLIQSPNADGPWGTIAEGLEAQGEYRWQPERGTPARVFIRVEASDAAGNIGRGTTPEPVIVAMPRVVGKLGGVKILP